MVTVIKYALRENTEGEEFIALTLQGGLEMIKSQNSGRYYATIRTATIPSTLDEDAAIHVVGQQLPGSIQKVKCEPYEYTVPESGEVIELSHRYEYVPEKSNVTQVQPKIVNPSMNGAAAFV